MTKFGFILFLILAFSVGDASAAGTPSKRRRQQSRQGKFLAPSAEWAVGPYFHCKTALGFTKNRAAAPAVKRLFADEDIDPKLRAVINKYKALDPEATDYQIFKQILKDGYVLRKRDFHKFAIAYVANALAGKKLRGVNMWEPYDGRYTEVVIEFPESFKDKVSSTIGRVSNVEVSVTYDGRRPERGPIYLNSVARPDGQIDFELECVYSHERDIFSHLAWYMSIMLPFSTEFFGKEILKRQTVKGPPLPNEFQYYNRYAGQLSDKHPGTQLVLE